jgi:protocatechuate 3,4-dioxygenase beta subunit
MSWRDREDGDLHDRGLQFDLRTMMQRRHILKLLGGAAALAVVGTACSDNESSKTAATGTPSPAEADGSAAATRAATTAAATVSPIPTTATTPASGCTGPLPEETAGPFPGDGSNGPNALAQSGIVRSDIRQSIGASNTVAQGVPLAVALTVVDTADGCRPIEGAAVYLWHCDREGNYSMYSQAAANENYLRGVQVAGADGLVTFQSIFPAAYQGRWPHIHFEVYPSLDRATSSANKRATSQLALPEDVCNTVYATAGYEASVRNMARTSLASDNVFRDGWTLQMATVTGSVAGGYTATLLLGV